MIYAVVEGEKVKRYGQCQPEDFDLQVLYEDEDIVEAPFRPTQHWWSPVEQAFIDQAPMLATLSKTTFAADGLDSIEITGAPLGALVTIRDSLGVAEAEVESSDPIVITTDAPGLLSIGVRHYKHLPFEVVVEAV